MADFTIELDAYKGMLNFWPFLTKFYRE